MKIDGLTFGEAVERLADKSASSCAREDGDGRDDRPGAAARPADRGSQGRAGVLRRAARDPRRASWRGSSSPSAVRPGRGRDFGVGLRAARRRGAAQAPARARLQRRRPRSPPGWSRSAARPYDRFRGRLLWPIRDASGDTIGFGARRIFDDDKIEAKYLNTSETPIYKKSQVLYGIDLARRDDGRSSQAVVVEGYTDVMACHLAGVPTAVATCGTAFGDDHARVLRRFLHDHEEFRGEVIFTFDGDAAGQKAALKAFNGDQNFVSQTYVAIEPDGLDPCDLRIQKGDAAVRELVARRQPLYRFVLTNVASKYDLDRADGRIDALREARRPGVEHPRQVEGRRVRPGDRRHARRRRRRRPLGGPPRGGARLEAAAGRPARTPQRRRRRAGRARPAAGARPARPAVRDRARDAQDRASSTRCRSGASTPSAPTTSPTPPTAACGRPWPPPADPAPVSRTRAGHQVRAGGHRPGGVVGASASSPSSRC